MKKLIYKDFNNEKLKNKNAKLQLKIQNFILKFFSQNILVFNFKK
jgi:hypothetical protein